MLKAVSKDTVILGLDKENIKRLVEGEPILVKKGSVRLERDIIITYGHTLDDIAREMGLKDARSKH